MRKDAYSVRREFLGSVRRKVVTFDSLSALLWCVPVEHIDATRAVHYAWIPGERGYFYSLQMLASKSLIAQGGCVISVYIFLFFEFLGGHQWMSFLRDHVYRPQRSLGKVMFLQASAILLTEGGAIPACIAGGIRACLAGGCVLSQHALKGGGAAPGGGSTHGGMHGPGGSAPGGGNPKWPGPQPGGNWGGSDLGP